MFSHLDPKNKEHRAFALQERTKQLMGEKGLSYDEAWHTANAEPAMQPFVAEMKNASAVEDEICRDVRKAIMNAVGFAALSAAEKSMAGLGAKWKKVILNSALFLPLVADKNSATANAAAESIEMLAQEKVIMFVRAALSAAVEALSNYISSSAAAREIYTDPMFAPMVDFVKRTTGEDLRTGNAATSILGHALQHFIQGAISRLGLPALRAEIAASPGFEHMAKFLTGQTTPNGSADLSTRQGRAAALAALIQKRMTEHGESYTAAFTAVRLDPANKVLFQAMDAV